jgi:hypothetical protein
MASIMGRNRPPWQPSALPNRFGIINENDIDFIAIVL